ncbi:MAG: hypothetical protein HWD84_09655, partial [Flavobacteriaceae bacterium]|nr:hypothetical protein [Flavobacteriaceae bacterium]
MKKDIGQESKTNSKAKAAELNNSRPFDVHVWSNHSELNTLIDELWLKLGLDRNASDKKKRGPKPKQASKNQFKVLILDLYVAWQDDPTLYLAIHMSNAGWKTNSRYNALHLSPEIIGYVSTLDEAGLIVRYPGYEGRLTRIRSSTTLGQYFQRLSIPDAEIEQDKDRETIVLKSNSSETSVPIEYTDTEETHSMRGVLTRYNSLLASSYIDVCSAEHPYIERLRTNGQFAGKPLKV